MMKCSNDVQGKSSKSLTKPLPLEHPDLRSWFKSNIIRPRYLQALTGLSRTTIWRLERAGEFPKRIKLSLGAVGYKLDDIQAWIDSRGLVNDHRQLQTPQVNGMVD